MKAIAQSMASSDIDVQKIQELYKNIVGADNLANGSIIVAATHFLSDTESTHAHGLDHVPVGYIIIDKDVAGDIYTSQVADATNIYLKNNISGTVTVTILVF